MGVIRAVLLSWVPWVVLGAAGLWSLTGIAMRGLARDPRFDARPVTVVNGPVWGGTEAVAPIAARLKALGPLNLFDPAFEERIRGALGEVPGVAGVDSIRRLWPRRYAVDFTLRRPVAVVGETPVTADAVVLPVLPYARAVRGLFVIEGLDQTPPPPGARWESELLSDAIATLLQLGPFLDDVARLGIHAIDVSEADDPRRGVVLLGADGIRVRWGRPRAAIGENPVERKIAFLRIAAASVERVRGMEVDVRYRDLYLRESSTP